MKKLITLLAAIIMVATFGTTTVFAAHCSKYKTVTAKYTVCNIESCTSTGLHTHNRINYTAHYYGDGHNYHNYCTIEDCILIEYHSHDEVFCFGHTANDGHYYHGYCSITDCSFIGYHDHNGEYCFSHTLNDGHPHSNSRGRHH